MEERKEDEVEGIHRGRFIHGEATEEFLGGERTASGTFLEDHIGCFVETDWYLLHLHVTFL